MYSLPSHLASDNIFIINFSDLENRLEAEYYTPSIRATEETIRAKSTKKLRDFMQNISSGATPSVKEEGKYYATSDDGISFLRVQNLNPNGQLDLEDVKHINKETHENYLRRSQVKEGDLLVKITGVGRMAIASVAPNDFIGNTNQHMVVIRTGDRKISEYLASYLNLDIIEKLATRRATGATRPALDYPALKSIPIIENVDFSILEKALIEKSKKDAEAKILIDSIDNQILIKLGIKVPIFRNNLQNRIFFSSANEITGSRFDPKLYSEETKAIKKAILEGDHATVHLSDYIVQSFAGDWGNEDSGIPMENHTKCLVIRATEFDNIFNLNLENSRVKYRYINSDKLKKIDLQSGDLLIEKSGGSIDQPVGRISILRDDIISNNILCYSNFIHKIRVDTNEFNPEYLFAYLKTIHSIGLTEAMQGQTNGIRNLIMRTYLKQQIPKPDIIIQNEIADNIMSIRLRAKSKLAEAEKILETAKQEIEKQLLT